NPDLINGGTLHSMASIRLPQVSRMIPGESIEIKFDKISDLREVVDTQHHIGLSPIATPFAPRIFPRIAAVPPVIYSEYPDHINYRDSVPYSDHISYSDHVDRVVKIVDRSILPEKVSSEKRAIAESARTSDKELTARLAAEEDYLKTVGDKYRLDSSDPEVMAMLYRLNGATKNYLDELREVNASLPPMSEKAKMTVVIPAFNEEAKIEKTLRTWVNQREIVDGKLMDPQLIEFIILVNRPSSDVAFDRTAQVVKELLEKPEFANFNVHLVTKTFNFPSAETTVNLNGKPVKIAGRKRMGLIYKYGADLALLRNLSREDNLRKANHLLRTGGADVLGRNPEFASRVFAWFDNDPGLEQYVSRADFPPAIYEKLPLLHVANRLHEMMNVQMTQKRSNIGLGTYRMGIYAQAGGFNSGIDVREEIDLSRRIRTIIDRREARGGVARKRDTILNALDDPRRSIAVILAGKPITQAYDTWVNDAIRKVNIEDVGKNLPGEAKLNRANVQAQAQAIFQFYFKQILESPIFSGLSKEKKVRRAYNLTANYLKHSFSVMGINNYEYGYKGNLVVDSTKRPAEIAQNAFVSIKDINNLQRLIGKYPSRPRPDWVDGSKTRGSYNRDYKMGSAADGSTYRAPVRATDLARRVSRPIRGSTSGLLEGQREHLKRISREAESLRQRGLRQVREQLERLNRERAQGRTLTREDASGRLSDLRKGIDRDFREVSNVIGNDILSINHRIRNRIRELENQKSNETGVTYRFNGDIQYKPSFKRVNAFRAVTDEEFEQIWKDYDFKVGLKPVGESRIFGDHDRSEELKRISARRQVLQTKLGR
ncbi:MAG: hypothetical protein Q8P25_01555, partial [Candidatus Curtissbacteria bacterium]|nr:hypothetical protein [Candidatus Curtissbacteria bacterium]